MSISAINGTCAFLCRSVGAGRYWKAEGSDPCACGVGWLVLVSSSSRHQFATIPLVSSMVLFSAFPPSSAEWLCWLWLSPSNLGGACDFLVVSHTHGLVRIRDWGGGSAGVRMCHVGVRRWVFSGKAL